MGDNHLNSFVKKEFDSYIFFSDDDLLIIIPENEDNTILFYEYIDEEVYDYSSYDSNGNLSEIS